VPEKIEPTLEKDEMSIIETLCREINKNYALNIDENPVLIRCSETEKESKVGTSRIFAIGGSHIARLVSGLVCHDCKMINLSKPGWVADPDIITECAIKLKLIILAIPTLSFAICSRTHCFAELMTRAIPAIRIKLTVFGILWGTKQLHQKQCLKPCFKTAMRLLGRFPPTWCVWFRSRDTYPQNAAMIGTMSKIIPKPSTLKILKPD
jgi:hypothetical protein